ncbi:MAG TPA: DUF1761 domain-containing protein [Pseudacidobacterium sp.]|jgi:uncharacterized protein YacL|nr:DUF1761 domain-containing protein [Pseudacidobacterium sp.]
MDGTRKVRLNYLAILVSALVYFAVQGVWFTVFMEEWLAGIGKTAEELRQQRTSVLLAYFVGFITALVIAGGISWLTQLTGNHTIFRGVWIAVFAWVAFILTTLAAEYAFEGRGVKSLVINAGGPLIGMVLMGAILGGWKARPKGIV